MSDNPYDLLFLISTLILNVMVIGVYLLSAAGQMVWVKRLGAVTVALIIPFTLVLMAAIDAGRELRTMIALGVVLFYLLVELVLDFVLKVEFRKRPMTHIPYIILFYAAEFSLIWVAFQIDMVYGWLVSISFWGLLAALVYNLWRQNMNHKKTRAAS